MPSNDLIPLSVDGRQVQAKAGARLLDVLRANGVRVPTLCDDERLTPYGGCRLCVVARRDGRSGLIPACSTPVLPGMVIETASADVLDSRRQQLLLLTLNHRVECPSCDRHGDCRFQDLLYEYGVPNLALPFDLVRAPRDDRSPVIARDPEKCILCGKCVRLCDEVQGVAAIGLVNRGLQARVATLLDQPLDCEFCGQCVNACPVGALTAAPYVSGVPAWLRDAHTTTCSFCSCGCQLDVETHGDRLVRVTSATDCEPNSGKLCVKGWLGLDAMRSDERLTAPLVRRDGHLVEASWDEALAAVADAVRSAQASGERIVGIGGSRLSCEATYLMQRLFRAAGTADVGLGPAGGASALCNGIAALTDAPRSSATFDDLRQADVVFVLRADPTRTHPLVKTELVQGVKQRGQKLALAHALSGGLERHATVYLPLQPEGEEALLNGLAAALLAREEDAADGLRRLPGYDTWAASVMAYTPDTLTRTAGVRRERFEALCSLLFGARRCVTVVLTGLGIPGDEAQVTRAAVAFDALLGARGGGVLILGEKANLQGAIDTGLHPDWLPGGRRAGDADARATLSRAWGHEVVAPGEGGLLPIDDGRPLGLLYLAGQDPLGRWPNGAGGAEAVGRARAIIVQDAFLTETARLAHVVLPVAILAERRGSTVGADGVRRAFRRVMAPPAGLPQDEEIFQAVAAGLGVTLPAGRTLETELAAAVGWPLPRVSVRRLLPARAPAIRARRPGIRLDASPQLFGSGSITERSRILQNLAPSIALRISPSDAAQIGVGNGDPVRLSSGDREALLRVRLDRTVRAGTVLAHWGSRWGNATALMIRDGETAVVEIRRS